MVLKACLICFVAVSAFAQVAVGPRVYSGDQDQSGAAWKPPTTTVSGLPPASGNAGKVFLVTDSNVPYGCGIGGSSYRVLCVSNGSSWVPLVGGDVEGVGNCYWGNCFQSIAANRVFASPNGSSGVASFRALVAEDLPVHDHWVPWQAGVGLEQTPTANSTVPVPVPIPFSCGGSGSIEATRVSVTALTKGTGGMTFNVQKCTASGSCVALFSSDQTYSNTGDNRQDFTPNQNNTALSNTDYFRIQIGSTVNGQDDLSIVVSGRCKST